MAAWEQFDFAQLDGRLMLIAGYLANKIEGKRILDLNCGKAPLLRFLPQTWAQYIGTDTDEAQIEFCRQRYPGIFYVASDDCLPTISGVDILLVLGYAALLNRQESQTLHLSIVNIATQYRPESVVIDAWFDLPDECQLSPVRWQLIEQGYSLAYHWVLDTYIGQFVPYQKRQIYILERP